MTSEEFGRKIKKYRTEHGYSLRDLYEITGLSHSYLANLEKGYDPRSHNPIIPPIETIKIICDLLNIPLKEALFAYGYHGKDLESQVLAYLEENAYRNKVYIKTLDLADVLSAPLARVYQSITTLKRRKKIKTKNHGKNGLEITLLDTYEPKKQPTTFTAPELSFEEILDYVPSLSTTQLLSLQKYINIQVQKRNHD